MFGSTGFAHADKVSGQEEEHFFQLSGASKFRDGDLKFLWRKLDELDGDDGGESGE